MLARPSYHSDSVASRIEDIERSLAGLEDEVRRLTSRLARFEFARPDWRTRCKRLVKQMIGFRLHTFEQYPPRPLRLPKRYQAPATLSDPPVISIVTPSFNHGRFIEATLASVVDQDYHPLEYIVQDGGSRDDTMDIVRQFASRLKHFDSARDRGQSHAINLGFAQATGDIMAYLNSDDILLPGSLHYVASYFAQRPDVDVVYGHRVIIDAAGNEIGRFVLPRHSDRMLAWADYVPQETMFWRKRIWDRAGGAIDESFQFAMDWDLLLRFREAGAKFVRLPRFLGAFRVHDAQKTQTLIATTGEREMARLRTRTHGREVNRQEIRQAISGYVVRQALHDRLYRWGLLRY